MKAKFKRIDGIAISAVFFYLLAVLMTGVFLDAGSGLVVQGNPIQTVAEAFAFPLVNASLPSAILLTMFAVYSLIFAGLVIVEIRLAQGKGRSALSVRNWAYYAITFFVCYGLAAGIGISAHAPVEDWTLVGNSFLYVGESFFIALLAYLVLFLIVLFLVTLVTSIRRYRVPFGEEIPEESSSLSEEEHESLVQEERARLQGSLAATFGANAQGTLPVPSGESSSEGAPALGTKTQVFPGLSQIEVQELNEEGKEYLDDGKISLRELAERFRRYLAKEEKLYYDIHSIRAFLAGLSASRLIILEGLSGTGKSSLARYFSAFIGEKSFFAPVQATWRDRTSLLGFYNDFSRSYSETPFLKRLYRASFRERAVNIMVLDEMNIARVEYYFADFLSIMEYPMEEWTLDIMQLPYGFEPPMHLDEGRLHIPATTWFIGTANKDDSTYTITDKVYDRAIVISFSDQNVPFEEAGESAPVSLSYQGLLSLFEEAQKREEDLLDSQDRKRIQRLASYCYEKFELAFGNRIMNQIEVFVPTYVACGGTKEEAIDFMFARKVLAKLEGRFEEYVGEGLRGLEKAISSEYGKNGFPECRALIAHYLRRFN